MSPRRPIAGNIYSHLQFWRDMATRPGASEDTRIFARHFYKQAEYVADRKLYRSLGLPMPARLATPPPEPQEYRDAMARVEAKRRPRALRG